MFKVTARTILELGSELISSDIIAFYELVKNGFDAGSKTGVSIDFNIVLGQQEYQRLRRIYKSSKNAERVLERCRERLNSDAKETYDLALEVLNSDGATDNILNTLSQIYDLNTITISDTGCGMSETELREVFLVIGTGSRKMALEAAFADNEKEAPYLGEKGLGRLSAMRLGDKFTVRTSQSGESRENVLEIDWRAFDRYDAMLGDIAIAPKSGETKKDSSASGTKIEIASLKADWTKSRVNRMARDEFALLNDPMDTKRKRKRIVLRWNDERISIPSLDRKLLDHAHAKVKGEYLITEDGPRLHYRLEIEDLGFGNPLVVEDLTLNEVDLESSIIGKDSGIDPDALENVGPFTFEAYWYNRRRLAGIDSIGSRQDVLKLQKRWTGIRLYRDGFRVFPYGSENDDWLSLDRKALMSKSYLLNKIQFIGSVSISRFNNPFLIDQTNREGLRVTSEQRVMLEAIRMIVQSRLRAEMISVTKQYKKSRVDFVESESTIKALEKRAKSAMRGLRLIVGKQDNDAVDEVQQTLFDFADFARRARERIKEVEADAQMMINLAGIGLLVEVVAHELARSSEDALDNLNALKKKKLPNDEVQRRLESLKASMTSISKRLRILDPLSVSGRQAKSTFSLNSLILETFDAHETQFKRHEIHLVLKLPDEDIKVTAVKGFVVQVLENLISNSVYWLSLKYKANKTLTFKPKITLTLDSEPATITFEDNGPGIAPAHSEKIFQLYYSTKEVDRRRGMGLYIARDCARHHGGDLELDLTHENSTGRLSRFVYTFGE